MNALTSSQESFKWIALAMNCLLLMTVYMSLSSWAVAVPALVQSFELSSTLVMMGAGLLILGYGIGSYVEGILLSRYGWKKTLAPVMVAFILSSLAIPYAPTYWLVLLLRFVQGWGLVVTITTSCVSSWFLTSRRGLAIGTLLGMIAGGVAVGGLLTGFMYPVLGWRLCFVSLAILVGMVTILYFIVMNMREPIGEATTVIFEGKSEMNYSRFAWLLAFCSFCLFFQLYGMYSILGDYLHQLGYSPTEVGSLVFINGLVGLVASPLGGLVSDKLVGTLGLLKSRGYTSAIIGYGWSVVGNWTVPFLSLLGYNYAAFAQFMIGAPGMALNGPLFALPADLLGSKRAGDLVARMILVGSIGGFLAPTLIVSIAATYGWVMAWCAAGASMIPGVVVGLLMPKLKPR
jgi:MFS family permease